MGFGASVLLRQAFNVQASAARKWLGPERLQTKVLRFRLRVEGKLHHVTHVFMSCLWTLLLVEWEELHWAARMSTC